MRETIEREIESSSSRISRFINSKKCPNISFSPVPAVLLLTVAAVKTVESDMVICVFAHLLRDSAVCISISRISHGIIRVAVAVYRALPRAFREARCFRDINL